MATKATLTMESITASLSPRDIANAHEVSSLLLKIYRTLIHMQYLPAHLLTPGPHDLTHLFPLFEELELAPQIIYLYSVLPYISSKGHDFYQGGYYADFQNERDVEDARNTMYADDRREQMRPWMTPLSLLCNHMCVLFYDSRRHAIGIFNQTSFWTSDKGLKEEDRVRRKLRMVEELDSEETGEDSEESESEQEDSDDSDSEEDEEGKIQPKKQKRDDGGHPRLGCGSKGQNVYDDMPSRPAGDVLRDILREYETLEEVPWVYEHGSSWDWPEGVKELFFKHGWPRPDFDTEAFELDRMRAAAMERVKHDAMELFKKVDRCKGWIEERNCPSMLLLKRQAATAETPDEEWLARYQIWNKEREIECLRHEWEKAVVERDRRFPNGSKPSEKPKDWIMWELRKWRQDIAREEQAIKNTTEQAEMLAAGLLGGEPPTPEYMRNNIEAKKRHLVLLHKVLEVCKRDAERLCPGQEELSAEDELSKMRPVYHSRAYAVDGCRKSIEELENFRATVPTTCQKAMELIQGEIESLHKSIKHSNQWWDKHDVALKEEEKRKEALAAIKSAAQKNGS